MTEDALSRDGFLDGRVQAWQPVSGYRAATDPVLLAAAMTAQSGQAVLELGCGVGVASLCLCVRVPGLSVVGVERQDSYADLARRNVGEAGAPMEVITADLTTLPTDLRQRQFDHVFANPPYFAAGAGTDAPDPGRAAARREDTPLADWVAVAKARLKPKGWLTMILSVDRMPDVLSALDGFGAIAIRPLQARSGRAPGRFLIRARKGSKTPFQLLPPCILHEGAAHERDGDDSTAALRAVLRDGAALPWT